VLVLLSIVLFEEVRTYLELNASLIEHKLILLELYELVSQDPVWLLIGQQAVEVVVAVLNVYSMKRENTALRSRLQELIHQVVAFHFSKRGDQGAVEKDTLMMEWMRIDCSLIYKVVVLSGEPHAEDGVEQY
jgi:hypothetical protein